MIPGAWYEGANSGTWVSIIQPDVIAPSILQSYGTIVNTLDSVEAASLCYLIAFDLDHFESGLCVRHGSSPSQLVGPRGGADEEPRLRGPMASTASPARFSGPDQAGYRPKDSRHVHRRIQADARRIQVWRSRRAATTAVTTASSRTASCSASSSPAWRRFTCSTMASVGMKTWSESRRRAPRAHQACAPERRASGRARSAATGEAPRPAALVANWGPGNWSGSAAGELRALRAGACLQESGGRRFLIYGWFSTATPSAMARVFQAYGCRYAMLLDMNALEHTYLAVYTRRTARSSCSI